MSPALNGSSAVRRFEGNDAIEIRYGITFDFYTGLPHIRINLVGINTKITSIGYTTYTTPLDSLPEAYTVAEGKQSISCLYSLYR